MALPEQSKIAEEMHMNQSHVLKEFEKECIQYLKTGAILEHPLIASNKTGNDNAEYASLLSIMKPEKEN